MKKRMAIMLIIIVIVLGGLIAFYFFKQAMMKKFLGQFAPPPATVTTVKVEKADWHPHLTAIGSIKALESIEVSPEIGGKIDKIYFKSGEFIKAGQPLVDLNNTTQEAQLKADQAQLQLAQINYQRDLALLKRNAVSRSTLDSSLAQLQAAQAAVEGDEAQLQKLRITAPFSGKLGIREASLGQYVAPPPAQGDIVPLSTVDPMLVQFTLSQQDLPSVKVGQEIEVTVDAFPNRTFKGNVTAINSIITSDSRTMLIQANVDNSDYLLVPGMFVNVRVNLPTVENVLSIPQTAVVYSLYGNSVYVVEKDNIAKQVFVTLGETHGINVAITKGLKAGDTIITSGQLKVQNNAKIIVNNKVLPN